MEFSTSKCGILIMQKRKFVHTEGFEFPSSEEIKEIDLDSGDKHLGILEAYDTMKVKLKCHHLHQFLSCIPW